MGHVRAQCSHSCGKLEEWVIRVKAGLLYIILSNIVTLNWDLVSFHVLSDNLNPVVSHEIFMYFPTPSYLFVPFMCPGVRRRRHDTGGRSGDRIPVEAEVSAPVHTSSGAHPSSYTRGNGSVYRG